MVLVSRLGLAYSRDISSDRGTNAQRELQSQGMCSMAAALSPEQPGWDTGRAGDGDLAATVAEPSPTTSQYTSVS